jgi:hypothetical protein
MRDRHPQPEFAIPSGVLSFVKPLFSIAAFLLLAVWLPATNHCTLDASGVIEALACDHEEPAAEACEHDCTADVCERIETASFGKDVKTLKVLPPPLTIAALILVIAPTATGPDPSSATWDDSPEVRLLQRTWVFAQRAAVPARAPDALA